MVRIMPGTDLTKPADPEWGKLADKARLDKAKFANKDK